MKLDVNLKTFGRFNIVVENGKTGKVKETGWQDNLVLSQIFSAHRGDNKIEYLRVWLGTGATPPTKEDQGLESPVGGILGTGRLRDSRMERSVNRESGIMTYTFNAKYTGSTGQVRGNISEIGLSASSSKDYDGIKIFTRALLKDAQGSPVTITLGEFDKVVVEYTIGWEIDLNQDLLDTTIDYKGVQTSIVARFIDWGPSSLPRNDPWSDKIILPWASDFQHYEYAMIPGTSSANGISFGNYVWYYGSTSGPAVTLTREDAPMLTRDEKAQRMGVARLTGRSIGYTKTSLTTYIDTPISIAAGSHTGFISAIVTSLESSASGIKSRGGRVGFLFDPPLEKLDTDEIIIENISLSYVVG
ncbi:hypothetical protein [Pseudoalteromonas phage vB_Pun_Y3]